MKTLKLFVQLSILMVLLTACPKQDIPDMSYSIINNCSEKIYLFQNNIDTIMTPKSFPKATLVQTNIDVTKNIVFDYNTSLFNNNRKLNILIYKESTLSKYSWEEIQKQNIFDKRYILSLDDLKAINYTVVYNGK